MLVGDLSQDALTEAYTLLSAYVREEGKLGTTYNKELLTEAVMFLSSVLQDPGNFIAVNVDEEVENTI